MKTLLVKLSLASRRATNDSTSVWQQQQQQRQQRTSTIDGQDARRLWRTAPAPARETQRVACPVWDNLGLLGSHLERVWDQPVRRTRRVKLPSTLWGATGSGAVLGSRSASSQRVSRKVSVLHLVSR